jgi:EmrB/QacA subfamily drug resistance transporter
MIVRPPCDEGAIRTKVRAAGTPVNAGRWVLVATILGSSMVFIDSTVVNVVLPVLQADLHATSVDLQWIVIGYTLFLSSLLLVGGSLGDHYGRRRIFLAGVVLFAGASMLCGIAPNAQLLIIARCAQGVGSALLTPGSLALIGATFDESERGKAIGTWSSVTAVMAALGPGLGGWLAEHASWRWIFYINVPLAVAVIAVSLRGVPESKDRERVHRVDWLGAAVCTGALGAIVYGLIFGAPAWSVVGVALLVAFVLIEARSPAPLVPLSLFASKTFSGVNALTLLLYGALGGALFFLPFKMIQIDGYSPTAAGFSFLPFIALIFALSRTAGGLVASVGARLPLVVGPLITATGFIMLASASGSGNYWTAYLPAICVMGIGMAAAVAPLTTTVMESVDSERMGTASGINNAVSRVAGMLAIAVLSALMLRVFTDQLRRDLLAPNVPESVFLSVMSHTSSLAATGAPPDADDATKTAVRDAVVDAYLVAFRITMSACAGLAVAGAIVAGFTLEGRKR